MFRSLLVPLDLTPKSERVVARAAALPLARDARVSLLHVVPRTLPRIVRRRMERDARAALDALAARIAPELPSGARVRTLVEAGSSAGRIVELARSREAEIVVLGRLGAHSVREIFLGSTAERVVRQGEVPVLVVRLPPHGPYRRPLLALDLDGAAADVLAVTLRLIPAPRPRFALVHAGDAPFRGAIYPSLSVEEAREFRRDHGRLAHERSAELLALARSSADGSETAWEPHVEFGAPRATIPKMVARLRADLLALGTHGRTGAARTFLGTVAGDVLRRVPCDVLVVPPGHDAEPV